MRQFGSTFLLACVILTSARADQAGRMFVGEKGGVTNAGARVLVRIDKTDLTADDLEALTAFRAAPSLAAMNKGKPSFGNDRQNSGVLSVIRRRVTAEFMREEMLAAYARSKGLAPDSAFLEGVRRDVERFLATEKNGHYRIPLEKLSERLALAESARRAIMADFDYVPEPSVVSNVMSRMRIYNERVEATNQAVRVAASRAALEAARTDADFQSVAVSNGVAEVTSDLEWELMDAENFEAEYPKMFAALGKSPVGTISPPVEEDNAILIGKLVEKTEATEDEPVQYKVACMRFPFAIKVTERSYEETTKELIDEKRKAFLDEALDRINRTIKMKIVDPSIFRM